MSFRDQSVPFQMVDGPGPGRQFTTRRRVRLGDATPKGRLRLDAVARYLQDVANDDTRDADWSDPHWWVVRRTVIDVHEFNGILYEQEGIYYQTLINQFGCDSVIQLVLCFDYTGIGTLPNNELIYPNPSQDGVFYLPKLHQNCTLEL
jgi:hypothetical protein